MEEFLENSLTHLSLEDRVRLCHIAREHTSLPLKNLDVNVLEARKYSFRYPKQEEKQVMAVLCPAVPLMYLRLGDSFGKKVKITFVRNSFHNYSYNVKFARDIHVDNVTGRFNCSTTKSPN